MLSRAVPAYTRIMANDNITGSSEFIRRYVSVDVEFDGETIPRMRISKRILDDVMMRAARGGWKHVVRIKLAFYGDRQLECDDKLRERNCVSGMIYAVSCGVGSTLGE